MPVQVLDILRGVLQGHGVDHLEALHWKGKKDEFLVADAAGKGYGVLLTNDRRQLSDPRECAAIKKSRIHHVLYDQVPRLHGLSLAVAIVAAAALPGGEAWALVSPPATRAEGGRGGRGCW